MIIRKHLTLLALGMLALGTLALATACGDSSGPPGVATVDVTGPVGDLVVGQTVQLGATPRDAQGNVLTNRTVVWSTSSTSTATVGVSGLVTAVAAGPVTITATVDGKTGTRSITVVPPPVASVTVTSSAGSIEAGQTAQVTAVTRDAANNVLTGRVVTFATSDANIATVSGTGLVTGVAAGAVTITATSEGRAASTQITVTPILPANAPQIASVTPSPMVEGQPATITGTNFGGSIAANTVRVGGVSASITAATPTSIQIVVPQLNCKPAQSVLVDVTVAGVASAPKSQAFTPGVTFTLAVGQQQLIANAASFCLQFGAAAATESYLIGVQSVSEAAASLTPVNVTAEVAPGTFVTTRPAVAAAPVFSASLRNPLADVRALRMAKHRAAEMQIRASERALLNAARGSFASRGGAMRASVSSSARVPTIPATAKVGDVLDIRVPDRALNTCQNFIPIAVTVKALGDRAIFLEDNANPTGGYSASDYEAFSNTFHSQIYPTNTAYFGAPTDFDGNGRTAIVITREVNKIPNLLGVVYGANFAEQVDCPSSNEGEVFYGKAPDPTGASGAAYTVAEALEDAPIIVAHEFAHVIQIGRRGTYPLATAFQATWELEGQATFAEEVNGYAATGLAPGQNLGIDVAFDFDDVIRPIDWFVSGFFDLLRYYGLQTASSKVPNAPEQCTWLGLNNPQGSTGPCIGGRDVYGVPWTFLRWLSDHFGGNFPGGEKGLHQRLIDNSFSGHATISDVIGVPIDVLLAQWAAALYLDDRVAGLDPKLAFKSWNMFDIESGLVPSAHLAPRSRPFGAFTDQVAVRGGSTAYFIVSGSNRGPVGIRARDITEGQLPGVMRMWVVRMQ
jgi:hypothetical protein